MAFDAKAGILSEISKTNDPAMKTILLLLLGVFEEIGGKIDSILGNEHKLREMILNGHEPVHHDHHVWIGRRMADDAKINQYREWIDQKIQAERLAKESSRKIRDTTIAQVVGGTLLAVIAFMLGKLWS